MQSNQTARQAVSRPFGREGDFAKLTSFVQNISRLNPQEERHLHVGDLAWRIYRSAEFDAAQSVHLWEDKGTGALLGMGWYTPAHFGLDIVIHPEMLSSGLDKRILRWGEMLFRKVPFEQRGYAQLKVQVHDWDKRKEGMLTDLGFRPDMFHYIWYQHDLTGKLPNPAPPQGFELRLLEPGELEYRAKLHNKSFFTEDVSDESYTNLSQTTIYQQQAIDLVAVDDRFWHCRR